MFYIILLECTVFNCPLIGSTTIHATITAVYPKVMSPRHYIQKWEIFHLKKPFTQPVRDGKIVIWEQVQLLNACFMRNLMLTDQVVVELADQFINLS